MNSNTMLITSGEPGRQQMALVPLTCRALMVVSRNPEHHSACSPVCEGRGVGGVQLDALPQSRGSGHLLSRHYVQSPT
jgi:hypothetical protein